jgi:hypothetical protein
MDPKARVEERVERVSAARHRSREDLDERVIDDLEH